MLPETLRSTVAALRAFLGEMEDLGHVVGPVRAPAPAPTQARASVPQPARQPPAREPDLEPPMTVRPVAPHLLVPDRVEVPAGLPRDLDALKTQADSCRLCALSKGRTCGVFGEGPRNAVLMFVGEAPGAQEDRTGRPFVGEAGHLLDKILAAMAAKAPELGVSRESSYIANAVKCRPPHNDPPTPDQLGACRPYLEAQIALVRPRFLVALGGTAATVLTGRAEAVSRQRGRILAWGDIPLVVTYHPAALLRNEQFKKPVWQDMQMVLARLQGGSV